MSWTCPKCERELPWTDFRHYCKRVGLDTLFEGRSEELILVFDKILAEVAEWPKVLISTTPNCIVFYLRTGFLVIRPMKKWLDLKFYSSTPHKEKLIVKSVAAGKKYENHIRLSNVDELKPGIFVYIRESYELV
ncbi:hypothetical protein SAMN05192574_102249 [Mucilaginibacter gossypiicola]|uniref:DUF5655 domain-containing protein n=1 Tax=Mucilaginibacter gossypiicola TaxID=551995 RepID=A0A1H8D814_9SPHI|nr:DUF5655 domain-containing protein [Mucilaginibacter gossypiicola]SEN03471.1 hypothetical protein SAMN05192574_102249 [Mucilaginibacter gossypiicola]